jgi:trk system potassium uptake protein TrkH
LKKKASLSPTRLIALCFLAIILLGGFLLALPVSHNLGKSVSLLDAMFTSTSAVCVTGLVVVDTAETFSVFGRCVIAALIQIGGFGAACIGVGVTLLAGRRMGLYERRVLRESWNMDPTSGRDGFFRMVLFITLAFEVLGAVLSYGVFSHIFPTWKAVGVSIFHSISSFNNAGFDLMGEMRGFTDYGGNAGLSLITAFLIISGGLGYLVIAELVGLRRSHRLTLQARIVLSTTAALIFGGALVLWLVSDMTVLEAFFQSVSTRTAGFSTVDMAALPNAAMMAMCLLMFVGASPGSTGGGVKTTTAFVAVMSVWASATNGKRQVFRRRVRDDDISKAFTVLLLSALVVLTGTFFLCVLEPETEFIRLLFEAVSAFATVGLSAGLTPELSDWSRALLMLLMYIGRLGPITVASVWFFRPGSSVEYTSEHITIG